MASGACHACFSFLFEGLRLPMHPCMNAESHHHAKGALCQSAVLNERLCLRHCYSLVLKTSWGNWWSEITLESTRNGTLITT